MCRPQYSSLQSLRNHTAPTTSITTAVPARNSPGPGGEEHEVRRVDHAQGAGQQHRQGQQDVGRQPALGSERLDLAHHLVALADRVGHGVEHLGQVSADLTVDVDRLHHPFEVVGADPAGHGMKRAGDVAAQAGFDHEPTELAAGGLGGFLAQRIHRLEQPVAGAEAAGQLLEGVAELVGEVAAPLAPHDVERDDRRRRRRLRRAARR